MKFLSNAPLGEDLFEGKSQELVADAIVSQLKNNAEKNCCTIQQKMIGVEGDWGSGKSNLIEIVKKKLKQEKDEKFLFFTYDVWGHQEDLQRKAILNELVDFLIQKATEKNAEEGENNAEKKLKNNATEDDNPWNEKVKKATGVIIERSKIPLAKFSWGMFFCFITLLITPFCNKMAELEAIKNDNLYSIPLPIIIVLTPLILLALICLCCVNFRMRKEKVWWPPRKVLTELSAKFLSIYKNDADYPYEEYVKETNPSVMSFRLLLKELSDSLKDKHLIIFFDNMDRLPKEKVENLWSSIHTFFAEEPRYENISCIVSFDRKHIQQAFTVEENSDNDRGNDYIDKTFDIVFRIAPPVLSDWKKFFEIKWKDAFGEDFNLNEYDFVIQAYDILSDKNALTPRAIIRFINECVLQKKIFEIPERYIAIFNLRKKDLILNPLDRSCLGNLLPIYENDLKYDDFIAALVYQVPQDKAKSVIYATALRRALEQGDQEELTKISNTSFFEDILEDALNTIGNLKNAIVSLDKMEHIPLAEIRQRKLWEDLLSQSNKLMQFDSGKIESFQVALLRHLDVKKKINLAKRFLFPYEAVGFSGIRNIYEKDFPIFTPNEYVILLKEMEKGVSRDELKGILPILSIEPRDYIALLKIYDDIDWISFKCNDLDSYISNLPYEQMIELECLDKLPRAIKQNLDINDGLKVLFSEGDKIYNDDVFKTVIKIVSSVPKSKIDSNWLDWDAMERRLKVEESPEIRGPLLAFRLMFYNHPLQNGNLFDQLLKEEKLSNEERKEMFKLLLARKKFAQLIIDEALLKKYPIVTNYIKECIAKESLEIDASDIIDVLYKLNTVNRYFDIGYIYSKMTKAYLLEKEKFNRIAEIYCSDDFWPEEILPYDSLKFITQDRGALSQELINRLTKIFDSWNKDEWEARLQDMDLYGAKEAVIIKYKWSRNAKDAIEDCLKIEFLNMVPHFFHRDIWDKIIESLSKVFRRRLFKRMRDDLCNGSKMNADAFIFVGNWLLKYGKIIQAKGCVLRTIVPASLLENIDAANIIANNFGVVKKALNEESEAKEWLEKAKMLSKMYENYPLKNKLEML